MVEAEPMTGIRGVLTSNTTTVSSPLTREDLLRTIEAFRTMPPHPCRLGQHLISPRSTPGSLTLCSNCTTPVRVPTPWPRLHP